MRRRAKRDLSVIAGIALLLGVILFVNYWYNLGDVRKVRDGQRREAEKQHSSKGLELLKWQLIRETEGSLRKGATYPEDLLAQDGQPVNIVGFMVPLEQFRQVDEFLLLPLTLDCYFCGIPPAKDVMLIHMQKEKKTDLFEDPVLVSGTLKLNKGEGVKFFYSIEEASVNEGIIGAGLHKKQLDKEHLAPKHEETQKLEQGYDPDLLKE